jgi:hypothetical protein
LLAYADADVDDGTDVAAVVTVPTLLDVIVDIGASAAFY